MSGVQINEVRIESLHNRHMARLAAGWSLQLCRAGVIVRKKRADETDTGQTIFQPSAHPGEIYIISATASGTIG